MAMVELKGLHVVRSGGRTYVYAWRGGPRIEASLGTPAFVAAYNAAVESRRLPDIAKMRGVIVRYRASPDFQKLAPSTKRVWTRWLDRIDEQFGTLSAAQFDRPDKIRPIIRKWRASFAHQPRTADYAIQVLSRVCSYMVDPLGVIASNPCEGIKQLYSTNRAEIIWTEDDIAALRKIASPEVMRAVDLAAATGLRPADLVRLSWSHVQENAISITTSKSRHRREALIPLYDELRAVISAMPRVSTAVLTNSRKRPWTVDGLNSSFAAAMKASAIAGADLHFYDLRGTAATRFYLAGLSTRVIGEIMGWEEETVARIMKRYVARTAAIEATIGTLNSGAGRVEKVGSYEVVGRADQQAAAAMVSGSGVYFVRGRATQRIKIGVARNPMNRLAGLASGSAETLELVAVIAGAGYPEEAWLHGFFDGQRIKGEWFEASDLLEDLICSIASDDDFDWKSWLEGRRQSATVLPFERSGNDGR